MSTDDESTEEEDPLERLYGDSDSIDRERLASALEGIIQIDRESGDPIFLEGYDDLGGKEQFAAQLLYRRAVVALGDLESTDMGLSTAEIEENVEVTKSAIHNYASDLGYVDNDDEKGGYYIRDFGINKAVDLVSGED
ncbi:hypothetical protein NKF26_12015 [Haladaptatus sp. AB618]|uniref:hypothetical protein n=1 Tax=Haladaptatus sp. AB618 TaxID=2934173 RepID=UPI00209BCCFE|nr:hypothetical protein [Haladaptatus sp. AB618]MCO8254528.1 hypothetical protein [Haladaptatus sp. AB618]